MKRFNFIQINDDDSIQVIQQTKSKIQAVEFNLTEIHNMPEEILDSGTPGIYILLGNEDSKPYIGESTNIIKRITGGHMKNEEKMEWMERVIAITSTDSSNPFNKTQIQWIEKELIELFNESGIKTFNKTAGFKHNLSYVDVLELKDDLEDIKSALKLLKWDLNAINEETITRITSNKESLEVYYKTANAFAEGIYINGAIIVNEGSYADTTKFNKEHKYSQNIINRLLENDVIEIKDNILKFLKAHQFKNPSSAACIFRGSATNGWVTWRIKKDGKLLTEIREEILKDVPEVPYETIVLKINDNPDMNYHLGYWRISEERLLKAEVLAFAPIVEGKRTINKAYKIKGYTHMPEHNNRVMFKVHEEDKELLKDYEGLDVSYNKGANPCFFISKKDED
ncbi:DUF4357 domain-containing protein [Mycoplasma todarodis]|uniref:DUF4357 domain-containing protein n=1 Tax=Mycoplasma todarodis TaxID=1937191 RepID=A0A4R0XY18_9MOLU|nr:DUF4357 domain-containing protein [Mycoplasma todarodis]TCG11948.1 hypothetical protein C4B25_00390 [Mycoplasma todarodis]